MKKLFKTAEKKHTTFVILLSRDNKFLLITFLCQQRTIVFDYNRTCRNEKVTRTCEKAISTELYICIKNIQTAVLLILEMTTTEKLMFPSEFQNLSRMTRFWKWFFGADKVTVFLALRTSQIFYGKIPHPFSCLLEKKIQL